MKKSTEKLIGAVVCAAVLILIWIAYGAIFVFIIPDVAVIFRIVMGVIFALPSAVLLGVLIERIKEIRSGEEDDLSKY